MSNMTGSHISHDGRITAEQLRMRDHYRNWPKHFTIEQPPNAVFGGWHMRSFMPISQYRNKLASFSELEYNSLKLNTAAGAKSIMLECQQMYRKDMDRRYSMWNLNSETILTGLPKVMLSLHASVSFADSRAYLAYPRNPEQVFASSSLHRKLATAAMGHRIHP
jgi:hypothetical protein